MTLQRDASILLLTLLLAAGCMAADEKKDEKPANDPQFHKVLQTVAAKYEIYGRADNGNRWAPTMCVDIPGDLHASASKDAETHGGKLYFIYAKDAKDYLQTSETDHYRHYNPAKPIPGTENAKQVLVKQSWKAVKTDAPRFKDGSFARETYAERNGDLYKAGEQGDLFIMLQFAKDTPGTDEGWVYGTVSKDGKVVTSSGKVQSCMSCHVEAPRHRVFGLPGLGKQTKK